MRPIRLLAFFARPAMLARVKGENMTNTYTAIVKQDGTWWFGWIEEVPGVNCQEPTRDELLRSLRTTLREALEFNRQDALATAESGYTEELLTL